eukprot:353162-Chlamydomonas_euryale.AAC.4
MAACACSGSAGSCWHPACWEASPPWRRFHRKCRGRIAAMGSGRAKRPRKGVQASNHCHGGGM